MLAVSRLWIVALLGLLVWAPAASAQDTCGVGGYAYAGFEPAARAHGIRADLRLDAVPDVADGHVAGWVGVGGFGAGPGGTDEWLQVGIAAFADDGPRLYYEVTRPRRAPSYVELEANVDPTRVVRIAVAEMRRRPSWWRVWVDGRPVSPPVRLPGSHGAWRPLLTAESWSGGGSCNRFAYRFDRVRVVPRGRTAWRPAVRGAVFRDDGYRAVRAGDAFTAAGPAT